MKQSAFLVIICSSEGHLLIQLYACMLSHIHVQLFVDPWTVASQASLSMRFSRQEYRSGLSFSLTGIFLTQVLSLHLPHCKWILYHGDTREAPIQLYTCIRFPRLLEVFFWGGCRMKSIGLGIRSPVLLS